LRGGFSAEGVTTEVRRVEIPFEDLRAAIFRCDLCGEDSFTKRALNGGRLIEEEKVKDKTL
jgi:hypothetical protein